MFFIYISFLQHAIPCPFWEINQEPMDENFIDGIEVDVCVLLQSSDHHLFLLSRSGQYVSPDETWVMPSTRLGEPCKILIAYTSNIYKVTHDLISLASPNFMVYQCNQLHIIRRPGFLSEVINQNFCFIRPIFKVRIFSLLSKMRSIALDRVTKMPLSYNLPTPEKLRRVALKVFQ